MPTGTSIEEKLSRMGLALPPAPTPAGVYVPTVRTGNLVFVSGQVPKQDGEIRFRGSVGDSLSLEDGQQAARLCALNALAAIKGEIGDLALIRRVVKLTGFVRSATDFTAHPQVIDGASEFLIELFGDRGRHSRAAVGVGSLPLGVAVELEMIVEVEP